MRALDLFCGGGGAALGMIAAGFRVTGVDIDPSTSRPGVPRQIRVRRCEEPPV